MLDRCLVIRMTSRYELLRLVAFLALPHLGAGASCSHSKASSFQHSLRKGIIKLTESSNVLSQESGGSQLIRPDPKQTIKKKSDPDPSEKSQQPNNNFRSLIKVIDKI